MSEFKEGAKQAAVLIANSLAEGDLDQILTEETSVKLQGTFEIAMLANDGRQRL